MVGKAAVGVETRSCPMLEEVPMADVGSVAGKAAGREVWCPCPEVVVPSWVAAASEAGGTLCVSVVSLAVARNGAEALLRDGGEALWASELVANTSVGFTRPGVRREEVGGREVEGTASGDMEEAGAGEDVGGEEGSREETELVSSREGRVVHDTFPGPLLARVAPPE